MSILAETEQIAHRNETSRWFSTFSPAVVANKISNGDQTMPKFFTIGYGDRAGYDRTPRAVRDAAHAQDAKLRLEGAVMGVAGKPVQVRNPEASQLETLNGPFMSSALPIAGFAVIEAADMAEAIEKVSQVPCAVAHGVVEVWPLQEAS
jgi:hypothetical protein